MKIVSLIPSGTDIALALGLEKNLVGVSHCCDARQTAHLPVVTRSIIDSTQTPQEIDAQVSEALKNGESLYQTDRELLKKLAPDVVLTQTICDVCAVNSRAAARDVPFGARLVNLSAVSIQGLWDDIWRVANATGTFPEELLEGLQNRLKIVEKAVEKCEKPRVLVLEWSDPPFLGGHWVPQMCEIAGATHVLSKKGEASRRASWAEIGESNPQIIVLAPCGFDLSQTLSQSRELRENPDFCELPAVRNGAVWATNATALFSRCTPATIRGVEVLAGIFHPEFCMAPLASEAARCGT